MVVRAIDVSLTVRCHPFRQARVGAVGVGTGIRNEVLHLAVARAADPNAVPAAKVEAVAGIGQSVVAQVGPAVARFRISDVQRVGALIDIDAARPSQLEPLREERPVLIQDLDAIVLAIAHEQPAA